MPLGPPGYEGSPLQDFDLAWLARDEDGHLAWLLTGGSGVVPPWIEVDLAALDAFEDEVEALPLVSAVQPSPPGRTERLFWDAARRGLFAYGWDGRMSAYRLLARPESPLTSSRLPPSLEALARRSTFRGLCFCERSHLSVEAVERCGDAEA